MPGGYAECGCSAAGLIRPARLLVGVAERTGCVLEGESEKLMHVSPFLGMDQRFTWRVAEPGSTLSLHNREQGELAFEATLSLRRRELTVPYA